MHDMAQRPETLVRIAVIEPFLFFLGKPDPPENVRRVFRRNDDVVARVDNLPVGVSQGRPRSRSRRKPG